MRKFILCFLFVVSCVLSPPIALAETNFEEIVRQQYRPGLVRHIVLFRYKKTVTQQQKQEVIKYFLALKHLARRNGALYVISIESGKQDSGEGVSQGFEQGFIVTFKSQGDRNYYVGTPVVTNPAYYDPAHQKFKDFVGPLLDKNGSLVFDFQKERPGE